MGSSGSRQNTVSADDVFPWKIKPEHKDLIYDDDAEEYEDEDDEEEEEEEFDFGDYETDDDDFLDDYYDEDAMSLNSEDTLFLTQELGEYCHFYSTEVPEKYETVLDFMKDYVGYERPVKLTWEEKRDRAMKFVEEREEKWLRIYEEKNPEMKHFKRNLFSSKSPEHV